MTLEPPGAVTAAVGPSRAGRGRCHHSLPVAAGTPRDRQGSGARAALPAAPLPSLQSAARAFSPSGTSWGHPSEESQDTKSVLPWSVPLAGFVLPEFMQLLSAAL